MSDCGSCGATLGPDDSSCPQCGAAADASTASFAAIDGRLSEGEVDFAGLKGPALVVEKGPEVGEKFVLDRYQLTLGRDPESDIFLNDVTVSREHARLNVASGTVTIEDSGSLNGTYVNGVRVDTAALSDGDRLQIGRFQMVFLGGSQA